MIKKWDEIQERYDAIKNHKPRASRKLAELGEILSSAYYFDSDKASEMWQYIIDLNIADDIRFSKYYIASVYNKLVKKMKPAEAAEFIMMNPERVRIMLTESDDSIPAYHLNNLLRGFIEAKDVHNAIVCICYYYNMNGGADSGSEENYNLTRDHILQVAKEILDDKGNIKCITDILDELSKIVSEDISDYIELFRGLNGIDDTVDYEKLFEITKKNKMANEFWVLLWLSRKEYSKTELITKWVDYVMDCVGIDELPPIEESHSIIDDNYFTLNRLKHYVSLEKSSEELLAVYFGSAVTIGIVEEEIIWYWIKSGDWDSLINYIVHAVMGTSEDLFESSSLVDILKKFMDATMYDEYMDNIDEHGRSYKKLIKDCCEAYEKALVTIAMNTVGCDSHEAYLTFIARYFQRKYGNIEILKEAGFDEVKIRTSIDRLSEYARNFLESGRQVYEYVDNKLQSILNDLNEDYHRRLNGNYVTINIDLTKAFARTLGVDYKEHEEDIEELDPEISKYYAMALDDDIAEFYFKHFPNDYVTRAKMISACVHREDSVRAGELIDMMAETKGNQGYEELNGWGRKNMLTLMQLIDEFEWGKEESWNDKEHITDDMRESVKHLVYRMLPYLPDKSRQEFRESIYKIDPEGEDESIEDGELALCDALENLYSSIKSMNDYLKELGDKLKDMT